MGLTATQRNKIEPDGYWDNEDHRRQFLTDFAAKLNFDPLNARNWIERQSQLRLHGGGRLLDKYSGNLQRLLKDSFSTNLKSGRVGKETNNTFFRN